MAEAESLPVEPTPCFVSEARLAAGPAIVGGKGRVTAHSRTNPCGRLPDDRTPTFVELVEDWLDGYTGRVEPCHYCGGQL